MKGLVLFAAVFVSIVGMGLAASGQDKTVVTIGSGSATGVYHPGALAICDLLGEAEDPLPFSCNVVETDGSVQNIDALRRNQINLALVQSDVLINAARGSDTSLPFWKARVLFSVHQELFTLVTRADSDIKTLRDLRGERINLGGFGSGQRATFLELAQAHGMTLSQFGGTSSLQGSAMHRELCEGEVAAAVFMVGHPADAVQDLATACPVRIVSMAADAERLILRRPTYELGVIPKDTYPGQSEDMTSFGLSAVLITTDALPETVAFSIAEETLRRVEDLKVKHPALGQLEVNRMIAPSFIPYHKGALRAFRELGLID